MINQIIKTCKRYLTQDGTKSMWDQDNDEIIARMTDCIEVNLAYQSAYRATREEMIQSNEKLIFNFSEVQIFGNMNLFTQRLDYLTRVLKTLKQYSLIRDFVLEDVIILYVIDCKGKFTEPSKTTLHCYFAIFCLVIMRTINLSAKSICGFMKVEKTNKDSETLENVANGKPTISYFDGEIISRQFPFVTGKWGATIETDTNHWNELNVMARFPNYYRDNFDYSQLENFDHVYMRWKEKFILGESSKADEKKPPTGFYYICLQKSTGELTGYFYNKASERLQLLELKYEPRPTSTSFLIR
ncbi:unnamed protein product [Mesocestoides corti]|uniref:Dynein heavy chain tail domain-containing protein n=1 Tax=Mesocestoides corti TaxID=53468 RepID=A0A158QTW9_MESCO|nr:unnamed protein product [Mesocestoides corti]